MNQTKSVLSATATLCILCNSAVALNYKFTGTVTTVPSALASQFSPGETISGKMVLTQMSSSESDRGSASIANFSANIGGDYPITMSEGGLLILNDFGGTI